jgi:hypothetical protein
MGAQKKTTITPATKKKQASAATKKAVASISSTKQASSNSINDVPRDDIFSIFLTQGTLEIIKIGCESVEEEEEEEAKDRGESKEAVEKIVLFEVKKRVILDDVRFRGAISDFHCLKESLIKDEKINKAVFDEDFFTLRRNEEDKYGDGNNFEIALTKIQADLWKTERDEKNKEEEEKQKPKYMFDYEPKEWIDLGSALEIENENSDNFLNAEEEEEENDSVSDSDLEYIETCDFGVQNLIKRENRCVQASLNGQEERSIQYEFRTYESDLEDLNSVLSSKKLALFLQSSVPFVEECLRENESYDTVHTEFEKLLF